MAIETVQTKLDLLVGALDGQDAGAIITATEELATAVALFRGTAIPAGSEAQARSLITSTLAQLEAAAIRINVLKDWTRQRIDANHEIRGSHHRGLALSY
ncbi:hypothetical protein [Sphingopyxis sp.]|uniref:hypothetical protein n=1 Tax=Sphingopyxis sp. TaxID=1908224 RepID=UPI003D0E1F4C